MDRFFSKLDLRDIKIDPFRTSFPPDAEDEAETADDASLRAAADGAADGWGHGDDRPAVPAWAAGATAIDGPALAVGAADGFAVVESIAVETREVALDGVVVERAVGGAEVLKVSARSRPSAVAGAIAGVVRENGRAEVQAIGAGATNQAVKAVAIARDYLRETGIEAVCLPAFIDVTIDNEDRTAIRLVVEPR